MIDKFEQLIVVLMVEGYSVHEAEAFVSYLKEYHGFCMDFINGACSHLPLSAITCFQDMSKMALAMEDIYEHSELEDYLIECGLIADCVITRLS